MKALSEYNLFDPETLKCPHQFYQLLHEQAPVYEVPGMGMHLVVKYDLIREILKNTKVWSSTVSAAIQPAGLSMENQAIGEKIAQIVKTDVVLEQTLLSVDPPDHAKHRKLVNKLFSGSRTKTLIPVIQAVVDDLIDGFIDNGAIDFMTAFADPLPLELIRTQMGVPNEQKEFFNQAAQAAAAALSMAPISPETALERAQLNHDLQRLFLDICDARRKQPEDDMLTLLVEAMYEGERPLRDGEILSILNQFLVAGHETTTSAIGAGMKLLIENPDQLRLLQDDPDKTPNFVEEVLRMETPVQGLMRIAMVDTEIAGKAFAKGSIIMLRYAAGNHDPAVFEQPLTFDVCRKNARVQLAFGAGVHACVGAPLARQEIICGFTALLARLENFAFDPTKAEPENDPSFLLRGLNHLHITFDKK